MAKIGRPGLSREKKAELWERWKSGQCASALPRSAAKRVRVHDLHTPHSKQLILSLNPTDPSLNGSHSGAQQAFGAKVANAPTGETATQNTRQALVRAALASSGDAVLPLHVVQTVTPA